MTQSTFIEKMIKVLTHAKDKSPVNLKKYDIFVAGGFLGATMTKNISHHTHGHKTQFFGFISSEIPNWPMRVQYELSRYEKVKYIFQSNTVVCGSVAHSGGVPIKSIHPKDSYVVLENGREVEYGVLINALGLQPDTDAIKGFREALDNPKSPVYSNLDSIVPGKHAGFVSLFSNGSAFVYIPPYPFSGEIEGYNFLIALETWKKSVNIGQVSPFYDVTIINANDRFAQKSDILDAFIKEKIESYGIRVLYNTKLTEIDGNTNYLTLDNGEKHWFNNLYVHAPSKPNKALVGSGLLNENNLTMPVNHLTLQHPEFGNVFGIGDINDLKVQRSFLGGIAQSHVVRHNALRTLKGKSPNAEYDGFSEIPLYTGLNKMVTYSESYAKGEKLNTSLPILQYYRYVKLAKFKTANILKSNNAGPPKYKLGYPKYADKKETSKAEGAH